MEKECKYCGKQNCTWCKRMVKKFGEKRFLAHVEKIIRYQNGKI
jgi:hypothetical protein